LGGRPRTNDVHQIAHILNLQEEEVHEVIAAHDVGRAIDPQAIAGQLESGVVMGIGFASSVKKRCFVIFS
jgi:hypothetical protein